MLPWLSYVKFFSIEAAIISEIYECTFVYLKRVADNRKFKYYRVKPIKSEWMLWDEVYPSWYELSKGTKKAHTLQNYNFVS